MGYLTVTKISKIWANIKMGGLECILRVYSFSLQAQINHKLPLPCKCTICNPKIYWKNQIYFTKLEKRIFMLTKVNMTTLPQSKKRTFFLSLQCITKWQNGWSKHISGGHLIQPPCSAETSWVSCPVLCFWKPHFWTSPRQETPQPLWATYATAQSPSQ